MVSSTNIYSSQQPNLTPILIGTEDIKISTAGFVAENAGKLRDYYRIGKLLGSGKINSN
jgi:hypothetical protein